MPIYESDLLVLALYFDQERTQASFVFNIVIILENNSLLNFESSIILNDKFVETNLKHLLNDLKIEQTEENDEAQQVPVLSKAQYMHLFSFLNKMQILLGAELNVEIYEKVNVRAYPEIRLGEAGLKEEYEN